MPMPINPLGPIAAATAATLRCLTWNNLALTAEGGPIATSYSCAELASQSGCASRAGTRGHRWRRVDQWKSCHMPAHLKTHTSVSTNCVKHSNMLGDIGHGEPKFRNRARGLPSTGDMGS